MALLRLAFWWLVSLAAFALAALSLQTVLFTKPWLTLIYVPVGLAVLAGLIANPLVRPRIGLGRRPVTTLVLLAVLTLAAAAVTPFIVQQTQAYRSQPTAREQATIDLIDRGNALLDVPEGQRDVPGALALFRQACDAAAGIGCFNAGILLSDDKSDLYDPVAARTAYVFACDVRSVQEACGNLAVMLEEGDGGPKDLGRAYDLFVQACNGGVGSACGNLEKVTMEFRANGVPEAAASALGSARAICAEGGREAVCEFSRLP
jgi:TPR repeat protein